MVIQIIYAVAFVLLAASTQAQAFDIDGTAGSKLRATEIASFKRPWAMTFLPDRTLLITTKPGKLFHVTQSGKKREISGLWPIKVGGQGGLGDVVLHPDYAQNGRIYISSVEAGSWGKRGATVRRATLDLQSTPPRLTDIERIWSQSPKTRGGGHFSHRIAFGQKGTQHEGKMFITSGDRQQQTPAQDWKQALGKVIRLNDDGTVPSDNPWQDKGELAKSFWTTGHRNPLGIDFDMDGRLWTHEMGPLHGDELNLIERGTNYGWPVVSWGDNYSGVPIPDHDTRPEFNAPEAYWVPSIAPSGLMIYKGDLFPSWKNDAFIGGLVSRALIRVDLQGNTAKEVERFTWRARIREVEQGPAGAIWVLEDRGGRLLKLTPR